MNSRRTFKVVVDTSSSDSHFALARALVHECELAADDPNHAKLRVSTVSKQLQNGLKLVRVQIECRAQCGWLVEAVDDEATELERRALIIQKLLKVDEDRASVSLVNILSNVFPEFVIENKIKVS